MKKIIQVCSLVSLLVVFGAAAANAQSSYGTQVEIPFAFNIGDHSYEAGDYILRVEKFATGNAILSVRDPKTNDLQTLLLNSTGESRETGVKLLFDTIEGTRYLTKVRMPNWSYAVVRSRGEKDAAKARIVEKPAQAAAPGGIAN